MKVISFCFILLFSIDAKADCVLKGVQFLESGGITTSIATADFNLDGYLDVAIVGKESGTLRIFENQQDGSFLISDEKHFKNFPQQLAASDFNGDGYSDLAVAGSGSITILLNIKQGKFKIANRIVVNAPVAIAASNFNHDTLADLAVLTRTEGDGSLFVFLNNNGSFRKNQTFSVRSATDIIAAHLGSGSQTDLVVSSARGTITVFKGSPAGVFKHTSVIPVVAGSSHLKAGFINKDQLVDLVVSGNNGDISVLLGSNESEFRRIQISTPLEILGLELADFDHDELTDLLFVNRNLRALIYSGNGHGSFSFTRSFSFAFFTGPVLSADLNNDKNNDLVAADLGSAGIYYGNGESNFTIGVKMILKRGGNPIAGDFDGDSNPDLLISGSNDSILLRGKGNGSFYPPVRTILPGLGQATVSDFNGDGRSDIAGFEGFTLKVWVSLGISQFRETASLKFPIDPAIQAVDLNQDGLTDLAVIVPNQGRVFINQGNGTFGEVQQIDLSYQEKGIFADLNGDNFMDIAALRGLRLTIYLGGPNLKFKKQNNYFLDSCPSNVAAGDANGDGKSDLVIGDSCSSRVTLFLGDGTGNFSALKKLTAGGIPFDPRFEDFNADGKDDIFAIAQDPAKPSITVAPTFENYFLFGPFYWNRAALADFNHDGFPDVAASSVDSTALFLNCK